MAITVHAGPGQLTMPVLGATSPKESGCISTQAPENASPYGRSTKGGAQSPAPSNVSHRSLQSEALSQLSCNPGAITFRRVRLSLLTALPLHSVSSVACCVQSRDSFHRQRVQQQCISQCSLHAGYALQVSALGAKKFARCFGISLEPFLSSIFC